MARKQVEAIFRGVIPRGQMSLRARKTLPPEVDPSDLPGEEMEGDHDGCQGCILDVCTAEEGEGKPGQGIG